MKKRVLLGFCIMLLCVTACSKKSEEEESANSATTASTQSRIEAVNPDDEDSDDGASNANTADTESAETGQNPQPQSGLPAVCSYDDMILLSRLFGITGDFESTGTEGDEEYFRTSKDGLYWFSNGYQLDNNGLTAIDVSDAEWLAYARSSGDFEPYEEYGTEEGAEPIIYEWTDEELLETKTQVQVKKLVPAQTGRFVSSVAYGMEKYDLYVDVQADQIALSIEKVMTPEDGLKRKVVVNNDELTYNLSVREDEGLIISQDATISVDEVAPLKYEIKDSKIVGRMDVTEVDVTDYHRNKTTELLYPKAEGTTIMTVYEYRAELDENNVITGDVWHEYAMYDIEVTPTELILTRHQHEVGEHDHNHDHNHNH